MNEVYESVIDKRYCRGIYKKNNNWIIVSRQKIVLLKPFYFNDLPEKW